MCLFCNSMWHRLWYSAYCSCTLKFTVTEGEVVAVMAAEAWEAEDDLWGGWARLGSPILVWWGNGVSWGGTGTEVKVTCSCCVWHQKRQSHLVLHRASSPSAGSGRSSLLSSGVPTPPARSTPCNTLLAEGGSDPPEPLKNENKCTKYLTAPPTPKKKKNQFNMFHVSCPVTSRAG